MAGTSSSFQGSRPNLRCASYIPATVPGTPIERWPVSDELIALPAVSTYMSRVARVGAVSRKSSAPTVPSCIRVTMNPPPPMLPATGWTTASANATATAASTALPPRRSMSTPTSLASGCDVTTMACSPVTGVTRRVSGQSAAMSARLGGPPCTAARADVSTAGGAMAGGMESRTPGATGIVSGALMPPRHASISRLRARDLRILNCAR